MAQNLPERFKSRGWFPASWQNFFMNPWQVFDENFLPDEFSQSKGIRMYEENNELHVEVPLPGLSLKDIEVSLNKGLLWIKGTSLEEEEDSDRKYYYSSKRNYSYSLPLPIPIDENREPQAIYTDGILKISLQLEKQGNKRKIPVKAGRK